MAWISFAIVTVLFYLPCHFFGLGDQIIGNSITVNLSALPLPFALPIPIAQIPLPGTGIIRLFIYSVGLWAILCLVLDLLDRLGILPLLRWDAFRSGLLYAREPSISNKLAIWLAGYVVVRVSVVFVLYIIKSVAEVFWMATLVSDIASFIFEVADKILPQPPDPKLVVLCWFAFVVATGFKPAAIIFRWGVPQTVFTMTLVNGFAGEQRQRHKDQIRKNLLARKQAKIEKGEFIASTL
jgi:hypothetical protein